MCHRNVCWKDSPFCWDGFLILYYGISVSGFARKDSRNTSWADNPVFYYHFWSVIRSIMILKVEKYGMELDTRRIWRYGLCQRSEQLWIAVCEPSRSWYVPSFSGRTLFWKKVPLLWDIPRKKYALSFLYQQIPERFRILWVGTL